MRDKISNKEPVKMAIGFATGRKTFKNIVKTYFKSWVSNGMADDGDIRLHLLVAYDLKYQNTRINDYKSIDTEIYSTMDSVAFIDDRVMAKEVNFLLDNGVINKKEAEILFENGYAKLRNKITYWAIKNNMDYLLFIDDDEYPLAVITPSARILKWVGQDILATHLRYIEKVHITHGYHCGYISPIPCIKFNQYLTEKDFRLFIETISNDIIDWETVKTRMKQRGITFADELILDRNKAEEVAEVNGCKFISGSNLCLNLKKAKEIAPFYNPPGARGEDTFLSTCLQNADVLKVPCYTFHDGFLKYNCLLSGVLPLYLEPINASSKQILERFIKASIGWIRYKPLLLYITQRNKYETEIEKMKENLLITVPKLCRYFNTNVFVQMYHELEYYHNNVEKHFYT